MQQEHLLVLMCHQSTVPVPHALLDSIADKRGRTSAGAVKERGMLLVVQTLEVILQCCPEEAAALLKPALAKLLASILGNQEPGLVQASKRTCHRCLQQSEAPSCLWPAL